MKECKKPVLIVVADDDEDDRVLIGEAFRGQCDCVNLAFVEDGMELLELLRNSTSLPDLILLDLNMPGMSGIEVLAEIKNDEQLKSIPVIIFTTTDEQSVLAQSYCTGASSFIRKPASFERLIHIAKVIAMYWCEVVLLPRSPKCPPGEAA